MSREKPEWDCSFRQFAVQANPSPDQEFQLQEFQLQEFQLQEFQLQEHLEHCSICRNAMESDPENIALWKEARELYIQRKGESTPSDVCENEERRSAANIVSQIELVLKGLQPTDDPDMIGRIAGYEVSGVIGAGGMGVVLKAFDRSLDRVLAIKVLAPSLATSGAAKARFLREAKAVASVLHPNVIAIHNVSIDRELPFLVMPFIRGTTLQKRVDCHGPLKLNEILRVGHQIAAGLAASHERGVVHRDIKPSNILIEDGIERVTITDFGLARTLDDASITQSGTIAGTPMFMSPEQVRGETIDYRSDLFSFGGLLYTLCTGRPPFRAESPYRVMRRITDDAPTSIIELNPEIPVWFEHFIFRLMAKEVSRRPDNAKVVESTLRHCLAHVEQPQLVSLPIELLGIQAKNYSLRHWRASMAISLITVVCGLAWFLAGNMNPRPINDLELPYEQEIKLTGTTDVAGHEVKLVGAESVQGLAMSTQFDVSRMRMDRTTKQFGQSIGNGNIGGEGGGAVSVGGGGFAAHYNKPNLGLAFTVSEGNSRTNSKGKLVEFGTRIKVEDAEGNVYESPDHGPALNRFPDFEKKYPGATGLYVYRKMDSTSPIRRVHGELLVCPGERIEAKFEGRKRQTKKVNGEEFILEAIQTTKEGVEIAIQFPVNPRVRTAKTPQERFHASMLKRDVHLIQMEDSQGRIHIPTTSMSTNGSMQSSSSFTTSNLNGIQRAQGSAGFSSTPTLKFQFPALQEGIEIRSVSAIVIRREGEMETIPFTIEVEGGSGLTPTAR